ncbi:MAG: hypothetical protein JWR75_1691 [Devosia sp.]|nr:hypothetical protein [Devosia sp.]
MRRDKLLLDRGNVWRGGYWIPANAGKTAVDLASLGITASIAEIRVPFLPRYALVAAPIRAVTSISIFIPASIICTMSIVAAGRMSLNTAPMILTTSSI